MEKFYGWAGTISEFINIEKKLGSNSNNKEFHELMADFINDVKKKLNLDNFNVGPGNIESWKNTYKLFKNTLEKVVSLNPSLENEGRVVAEYVIPGSPALRTDFILILPNNYIFVIEFKGSDISDGEIGRFEDYINEIKHFHSYSKNSIILPWLLFWTTNNAPKVDSTMLDLKIGAVTKGAYNELAREIVQKFMSTNTNNIEPGRWVEGHFEPNPGILTEGIDILINKSIPDVYRTRSDKAMECIELIKNVSDFCKQRKKHAFVVVKGVPGAGKTMVGFGLLSESHNIGNSLYITGNGPLDVLLRLKVSDAVVENRIKKRIEAQKKLVPQELITNIFEFICKSIKDNNINTADITGQQLIYLVFNGLYQTNLNENEKVPIFTVELVIELLKRLGNEFGISEKIQSTFNLSLINNILKEIDKKIGKEFAKSKIMGMRAFESSNVNSPIIIFDEAQRAWKHQIPKLFNKIKEQEWGVLVALVGEGQIIHKKEVGTIDNWLRIAVNQDSSWLFFLPENTRHKFINDKRFYYRNPLFLDLSIRSLYWSNWHIWIDSVFKSEASKAKKLLDELGSLQVAVTRRRKTAENFAKDYVLVKGNNSYGWIGSSTGLRGVNDGLSPMFVKTIDSEKVYGPWFSGKSNELKTMISEFACQGLELDLVLLRWGEDLVVNENENLVVSPHVNNDDKKFILDKYRVLLTRARRRLVIWCENDETRKFLIKCGVKDLDNS